jgi:hypothetical protein
MRFSVQFTRGEEYAVVGSRETLEADSPILAGRAAKALLLDARAGHDVQSPDGYAVYDADGDWVEGYRLVAKGQRH